MKKYSLLFLILFFATKTFSQQKPIAYKSGEWLRYKMSFSGWLRAGTAILEVEEKELYNKKVFYTKGTGWTSGPIKLFFKVNDKYESYFDKDSVKPYLFKRKINEGGIKNIE